MKKKELLQLLKTLSSREMRVDPEGFTQKLKEAGLEKLNIKDQLGAKKGLSVISNALGIKSFFDEIKIEDEDETEDGVLKEQMNIWVQGLRGCI